MKLEDCPYAPCGESKECIGCRHDPQKRQMNIEQFLEYNCWFGCGDCKHCNPKANLDGVESKCKRIDHKKFQFAVPWFKSYDCGQLSGIKCRDFEPKESRVWQYNHWKQEFIRHFEPSDNKLLGMIVNKNVKTRYYISYKDFFNNTFKDKRGNLKWIKKCYYKQSKKSPTGYILVTEWNGDLGGDKTTETEFKPEEECRKEFF